MAAEIPAVLPNEMRERRLLAGSLVLLAVVYNVIALNFDSYGAVWSPDSGARFAMIRSWVEHGSLIYTYYPDASFDPTGQIHPLAYFLFHRKHDFCSMYLPLFPFLCGLFYRAFGYFGLTVVPILCALGTALVTYLTAKRLRMRSRLLLPLVLGLATPLLLYGVVFWDHTAIMLIAAGAGYRMVRVSEQPSMRNAVLLGAVIGLGMFVHELFLALFVAVWLAALPQVKSARRVLFGLPVGFLAVMLLWAAFNAHTYGTLGGPHLGANVVQNNSDHPFGLQNILDGTSLLTRCSAQLVGTAIFDAAPDMLPYYVVLGCLLVLYAFWSWESRTANDTVGALALSLCAGAACVHLVLRIFGRYSPAGIFQATPLLIPALAVPWYVRKSKKAKVTDSSGDSFFAWLSRSCCLFLMFLLINPMNCGPDWGSRYLLSALPLLLLLAARALEQQHEILEGNQPRLVPAVAVALIGMSVLCQTTGLIWIRRCLAYGHALNVQALAFPGAVLVTETDFFSHLTVNAAPAHQFQVRTNEDAVLFAKTVDRLHAREILFVGGDEGNADVESGLQSNHMSYKIVQRHPLWTVNPEAEMGDQHECILIRLVPKAASGGKALSVVAK